jgi:hypothetical protein
VSGTGRRRKPNPDEEGQGPDGAPQSQLPPDALPQQESPWGGADTRGTRHAGYSTEAGPGFGQVGQAPGPEFGGMPGEAARQYPAASDYGDYRGYQAPPQQQTQQSQQGQLPQQPQQYSYDWREAGSSAPAAPSAPAPGPSAAESNLGDTGSRRRPPTGYGESYAPQTDDYPSQPQSANYGSGFIPGYSPIGYELRDPYSPSGYMPTAPRQAPVPPQAQAQAQQAAPPAAAGSASPTQSASPSAAQAARPTASPDFGTDGLFDEEDLFGLASSAGGASAGVSTSPSAGASVASGQSGASGAAIDEADLDLEVPAPAGAERQAKNGYSAADFAFLEEATTPELKNWLNYAETRADSRADRIRKFRFRIICAAVALVLIAAGVGVYELVSGGSGTAAAAVNQVILLQISDSTGDSVGDVLLDPDSPSTQKAAGSAAAAVSTDGAAVVIPPQMVIDSTGFGTQPFSGNMSASIPPASTDDITSALGVSVSGVWSMNEITLAGLIDELGGVQITTTAAVPAATASPTAAAVPQGATTTLSGEQAAAYATESAPGDTPDSQATRFGQVVTALFRAMPNNAQTVTAYMNNLGMVQDPALPESVLAPLLGRLAEQDQAGQLQVAPLPLLTDGSNELNYQNATPLVTGLLGNAFSAGTGADKLARVLVQDASGHTGTQSLGIRDAAQAKLSDAGYTFLDGSTTARRPTSVVEIKSGAEQTAADEIATALDLPTSDVQIVSGLQSLADVTVLLGAEWPGLAHVNLNANPQPTGSASSSASPSSTRSGSKASASASSTRSSEQG